MELNIPQTGVGPEKTTSDVLSIQHFKKLTAGAGASRFEVSENGISVGTTTIVDENGLNSLANFRADNLLNISTFTTTSLSYVDVTGGTMDSFTLDRDAYVFIFLSVDGYNENIVDGKTECGYAAYARLYDADAGLSKLSVQFHGLFASHFDFGSPDSVVHRVERETAAKAAILLFGAGTHTLKLQVRADEGGTANVADGDIGYVILGI